MAGAPGTEGLTGGDTTAAPSLVAQCPQPRLARLAKNLLCTGGKQLFTGSLQELGLCLGHQVLADLSDENWGLEGKKTGKRLVTNAVAGGALHAGLWVKVLGLLSPVWVHLLPGPHGQCSGLGEKVRS